MTHITSLMRIESLLIKRNATRFLLSVGMPVLFYLIFSGLYSGEGTFSRDYLMSMTAFSMMSTAIFTLPTILYQDKVTNWQKLLRHTPVSMVEYHISKCISLLISYLVSIVVVFGVGHFVRHVDLSLTEWFVSAALLIMGSTAFVAIGLALTLLPNTQLTSVVGNILYMGLAVLGGLWLPISLFPSWMQTIGRSLPTYQLMHLITTFLDKGNFDLFAISYLVIFTATVFCLTNKIQKRLEVS